MKKFAIFICMVAYLQPLQCMHNQDNDQNGYQDMFLSAIIGQIACLGHEDTNEKIENNLRNMWTHSFSRNNESLPENLKNDTVFHSKVCIFLCSDQEEIIRNEQLYSPALTQKFIADLANHSKNEQASIANQSTQALEVIKIFLEKTSPNYYVRNHTVIYTQVCNALGLPEETIVQQPTNTPTANPEPEIKPTHKEQSTGNPPKKHTPAVEKTGETNKQQEETTTKKTVITVDYTKHFLVLVAATALVAGTIYLVKRYLNKKKTNNDHVSPPYAATPACDILQ